MALDSDLCLQNAEQHPGPVMQASQLIGICREVTVEQEEPDQWPGHPRVRKRLSGVSCLKYHLFQLGGYLQLDNPDARKGAKERDTALSL